MSEYERMELERINRLLKEKILCHMPHPDKYPTRIEGLFLSRREEVNQSESCFGKPSVAVVVQGSKCAVIGSTEYRYGENQCLVTGVDMPSAFYIVNPSAERPFLAVALDLDCYMLTQLAAEIPPPPKTPPQACHGVFISDVEPDFLAAFLRLVELLEKPEQIPVRAPMIIREIHYLLLIGSQGSSLRQLNTLGTQSNQVSQAISWLRDNYKEPFKVDELAHLVNMGTSTFHRHFKMVTGLSPLQYHKRLRLYEAQRLMLSAEQSAGCAALAVGYESETQFNREYKRLFGEPPHRDVVFRRKLIQ